MKFHLIRKLAYLSLLLPALANASEGGSTSAGDGNPSSSFCVKNGGISVILDQEKFGGSQIGICITSDHAMIEEWTLYRESVADAKPSKATEYFRTNAWSSSSDDISTWAASKCAEQGGKVVSYVEHLRPSMKYDLCEFNDSAIEIWTLFRGASAFPVLRKILGLQ